MHATQRLHQSQGAAMAVDDGAALVLLLGLLSQSVPAADRGSRLLEVLGLYQSMRKSRTATNVQGAIQTADYTVWNMGKVVTVLTSFLNLMTGMSRKANLNGDEHIWDA